MSALVTGGAAAVAMALARRTRERPARYRLRRERVPSPEAVPRPVHLGAVTRPAVAVCAFVGRLTRPVRTRHVERRWRARVERELPTVAELFRTALTAGLSPTQAIRLLVPLTPPASSRLLGHAANGLALGFGLDRALDPLRQAGPATGVLADALALSGQLGTEAASALERIADEGRARLRQQAESRARTVPVRLLFPLVLCVLPAFALLSIAPALLSGLSG